MSVDQDLRSETGALIGRRRAVAALASIATAGTALQAWPAPAQFAAAGATPGPAVMDDLTVFMPSNPGGGWDQTGRALGEAALLNKLVRTVIYENKGGKGGTVGLADFVSRYRQDSRALLVGGFVMLGALAIERNALSLSAVTPIARLTHDYMLLATAAHSPWRTMKDVVTALRRNPGEITFVGGSTGGVDHMLAAMILRSLGLGTGPLQYLPTSSGRDAVEAVVAGRAQVAISGYSEFKAGVKSGMLVPLAVSSRRSMFGVPSLREQGIETELANWRAVFAPAGLPPEDQQRLRMLVMRAMESSTWRQKVAENDWTASLLVGDDLKHFLEIEQGIAAAVTMILKLR